MGTQKNVWVVPYAKPIPVLQAARLLAVNGKTMTQALDEVLIRRRNDENLAAKGLAVRRRAAKKIKKVDLPPDPAYQEMKALRRRLLREHRTRLRDSLILRADTFSALVVVLETRGLPAHIIDEQRLAQIVTGKRWDLIPMVIANLVQKDTDVAESFHAFEDAAKESVKWWGKPGSYTNDVKMKVQHARYERLRYTFLHAASAYSRRLAVLENSLDKLSSLSLSDLEALASDGDDLSTRIAAISMKISDEIRRRDATNGASAKDKKLDPVREYAIDLAKQKSYPSRRQAVLGIKEDVLTFAATIDGVSMSRDQAETTIGTWLKKAGYTPSASKQGTSTA
ncbi:hypothetical protein [Robbsia andropogonis]|uniref:hypothetical protein n=1 Tax=Robbsia andropogonis TaxID=28092 RepID=UPI000698D1CF|nr:hypothetical protein [Robbsia andropogonis]